MRWAPCMQDVVARHVETAAFQFLKFSRFAFLWALFVLSGSGRFARIKAAVARGDAAPPVDLRYLAKAKHHADKTSELFSGVFSFLEQIYNSIAESLPDVRDCTYDSPLDPYAIMVDTESSQRDPSQQSTQEPKSTSKRHRRGVAVDPLRTVQAGCEVRWLPPGAIKDYWVQYKQQAPGQAASFPTFWRVPLPDSLTPFWLAGSVLFIFQVCECDEPIIVARCGRPTSRS